MKKILQKFSIRNQFLIASVIIFLIEILIFILIINLIKNSEFYKNHQVSFICFFWLLAIALYLPVIFQYLSFIIAPINTFNRYLQDFNNINFNYIESIANSKDELKLAKALNNVQKQVFKTLTDLQTKNAQIVELNEKQQEDIKHKQELVSAISHDMKTPLTVIYATISALRDNIFPEDQIQSELDNVLKEIEKTTSLVQETINVYRLDSEISNLNLSKISLIEMVTSITDDFQKVIEKYHQTLSVNFPNDIEISADKKQLERALKNLIFNAITHSPENNKIFINIVNGTQNNILEIINTGVTIPKDEINKVFLPFYQIDKSRNKIENNGNGLGLYISKEILQKHGFDIGIENVENGVKTYILFPCNEIKKKKRS